MAAPAEPLLHHLLRLATQPNADTPDAALLERFVAHGDEGAFAALLARHGPMVLGVCRRVLRDGHRAEDAFQATFLVLARKAGALRRPEALAAWLYGTARRLALTARRSVARRCRHETDSLRTPPASAAANPLDELTARELLLALDDEMERLPEAYRLPLILCGLEGRPQEEAARLLGWTPDSVRGRLERGRARLRARLARRGLAFGAGLLAVQSMTASIVSAGLAHAAAHRALAFAAGSVDGTAAEIASLAEAGVRSAAATKAKLAVLLLLTMGLAAGASALAHQVRTKERSPSGGAAEPKAAAPKLVTEKGTTKDRYGDPLPPGALVRMGTIRLRHGGHVMSVAFAPDGKTLVSGGFDGWAFLWDVQTGKRLRAFRHFAIQSVTIDPTGKRIALADWSGGTVKLYELATGKELASCPGHRGGTWVVTFSPDGKRLASGGKDKRIRVWDAATLREVRSWQAGGDEIYRLRFTPDGASLVSMPIQQGVRQDRLHFWDAATGAERPRRGPLANLKVLAFCFTADGKALLTSSHDTGLLQLWDLATDKEIRTVAREQWTIREVALAPDGKSVWTAAEDGNLRQWDLSTRKQLLHIPGPSDPSEAIEDLAVSPDGKRLAVGTHGHDVILWDTTTGRKVPDFGGHRCLITGAAFTPDGKQLWTGGFDRTIRLWSAASGEQLRCISLERDKGDSVYSLALRPDGKMLAVAVFRRTTLPGDSYYSVRLWDLITGEERKPLLGHAALVKAVAFSPDGRLLASRGDDSTIGQLRGDDQAIRLWDVATGKERLLLRCQAAGVQGIAFSPDGRRVISALDKETIGLWDVATGRLARRLAVGPSGGQQIPLLSRDGRIIITGGGEHPLHVWEVASGAERCRIERPNAKGYVVAALSPDCRVLAWFDYGQPIKLWDLIAGKPLGELGGPTSIADPLFLTFSPDGRRLASTHSDGTALIWEVAHLSPKADGAETIAAKRLEELWDELASADGAKAYRALRTLAAAPAQSVPLLRQRLPKSVRVDAAKIARLLADLDSEQFKVREKASRELQGLGMAAEAAVRRALRQDPALEVRRRLEQILDKLESGTRTPDELRILRAVEVLERIASPEARRFLEELARGSPDGWLTQEAKASWQRLSERSTNKP